MPVEGAFHRAPRPLAAWVTVLLMVVLVLFIMSVASAVAVGFWLTAGRGTGVPDMTGGLGNLGALVSAILGAGGLGGMIWRDRHVERMDQQARGIPPGAGPFPLPPSPDGSPRPGDSM